VPSPAATRHVGRRVDIANLLSAAKRARTSEKRVVLHASLAAVVAAWESYVEDLLAAALAEVAHAAPMAHQRSVALLTDLATGAKDRFNTPNAENARELLVRYTGYDCLPDWVMPRRGMQGIAVRTRLNEIVKVRHAFAHGFPMPAYAWNSTQRGPALSQPIMRWVDSFAAELVLRTDRGMARHLNAAFGAQVNW